MPGCSQSHGTLEVPDFYEIGFVAPTRATGLQVMPDDHSELEPPLPIPNRTVKRLCADDSEHSLVKVGHRQATPSSKYAPSSTLGAFLFWGGRFFRTAPDTATRRQADRSAN